jgi:hypothetical protein
MGVDERSIGGAAESDRANVPDLEPKFVCAVGPGNCPDV